jgi:parallel beta-helix repeat protein
MLAGTPNHGFLIRDAVEGDEAIVEPHTPPQLVLRYADSGTPPPPPPDEPAGTTAVTCGQVITRSVRLANDLIGCLGEGLVIGAPNIVLDLNGRTIRGGLPVEPGEEEGLFAGIRNAGHSNVTIRNGMVRDFGYGVRLLGGASYNVVEDMTFINDIIAGVDAVAIRNGAIQEFDFGVQLAAGASRNIVELVAVQLNQIAGIGLSNADENGVGSTIRQNTSGGNPVGIQIENGTTGALILQNEIGASSGYGLYVLNSSGNRIEDNLISATSDVAVNFENAGGNTVIGNQIVGAADAAFAVSLGSHNNQIEANIVSESEAGIIVEHSNRNELIGNTVSGSSDNGITLEGANDNVLRSNDLRFNTGGIALDASSGNLVELNNASETDGTGIEVGDSSFENIISESGVSRRTLQALRPTTRPEPTMAS